MESREFDKRERDLLDACVEEFETGAVIKHLWIQLLCDVEFQGPGELGCKHVKQDAHGECAERSKGSKRSKGSE